MKTFDPFFNPPSGLLGDTMPVYFDGRHHVFVMQMPHMAHFSTTDFVRWIEHETCFERGSEGAPDDGNIATGSIVFLQDLYYFFYTGNQNVCLATSPDLEHWVKHDMNPVMTPDPAFYDVNNFRDPFVFFNREDSQWWMLVGTREMKYPGQRAGCVARFTSSDLLHWKRTEPLWSPHIGPHCDCPALIEHQGAWYLFYLQRNTRYRRAVSPWGPFQRMPVRNLGTVPAIANSRLYTDGKRWITLPSLLQYADEKNYGQAIYGGPLLIPRTVEFFEDGTAGEKPVEEILDAIDLLPELPVSPLDKPLGSIGQWSFPEPGHAVLHSDAGGTLMMETPQDFYLEARIDFECVDSDFHLILRCEEDLLSGYQLSIHPRTRQISLRTMSQWDGAQDPARVHRSHNCETAVILQVFICGSKLDVFIDGRTSLSLPLYHETERTRTAFEFRDGPGKIRINKIRQLRHGVYFLN